MPFMREIRRGVFAECNSFERQAFGVSWATLAEWDRLVAQSAAAPRRGAYRVRPYPAMNVAAHAPFAPDGIYVDHRDPDLEVHVYQERDRLLRSNPDEQAALRSLATVYEFRHWRDVYNLVRNVGRRHHRRESGRDADGNLRWRRWNRQAALTAADEASPDTRHFGIELEFDYSGNDAAAARSAITRQCRADGLVATLREGRYGRDMSIPGWQMTQDSTVHGGELISDILAGNDASLDEVKIALQAVKDNGGEATYRQGLHIHHDVRDFTNADKLRLVDNLRNVHRHLEAYMPPFRRTGTWSSGDSWDYERRAVEMGRSGSGSHHAAYNFGHLFGPSPRVELRGFGFSLNFAKLRCWIRVGQAIMTATKAGIVFTGSETTDQFLATLREHGLSDWASDRFARRVGNVNGQAA